MKKDLFLKIFRLFEMDERIQEIRVFVQMPDKKVDHIVYSKRCIHQTNRCHFDACYDDNMRLRQTKEVIVVDLQGYNKDNDRYYVYDRQKGVII